MYKKKTNGLTLSNPQLGVDPSQLSLFSSPPASALSGMVSRFRPPLVTNYHQSFPLILLFKTQSIDHHSQLDLVVIDRRESSTVSGESQDFRPRLDELMVGLASSLPSLHSSAFLFLNRALNWKSLFLDYELLAPAAGVRWFPAITSCFGES